MGARTAHGAAGLHIVPVGLTFEDKGIFRSRVLLQVGAALPLPAASEGSEDEAREQVRSLTHQIDAAIRSLTLDHTTWQEARRVEGAARAFAAGARSMPGRGTLSELFALRKAFGDAYEALRREEPERVERVEGMLSRYEARLAELGLRDDHVAAAYPWRDVALYVGDRMGLVALTFVPAALGTLLNWVPYRLAGIVGGRVAANPDLPATFKLMASVFFFPVTWAIEAACVGWLLGTGAGLGTLLLAPSSGWFALLFHERHTSFWSEVRAWALLRLRRGRVAELRARRRALREELGALVDQKRASTP